jgi:ketosteroid isomerase-like protein
MIRSGDSNECCDILKFDSMIFRRSSVIHARRLACFLCLFASSLTAFAQLDPFTKQAPSSDPLTNPTYSANVAFLFDLEAKFARDVAAGGGAAFAKWFAEDGVTLANGKAPVVGRAAIAATTTWTPQQYQLTWTPEGGRMSTAGDMGFTWGHYEGKSKDRDGTATTTSGRYMTIWKKQPDGSWKVLMDSSNEEPAKEGDCCKLP